MPNSTSFNDYIGDIYTTVYPTATVISPTSKTGVDMKLSNYSKPPADFTFGCDPEAFVFYKGKPVAAARAGVPGTKSSPFKVEKGWVQVDGLAAEINIEPAKTGEEFSENISTVIAQLEGMLPKGHSLQWIPSVEFGQKEFDDASNSDKELGCQPDFDAWTGSVNPPPVPENPLVRCAGGHIHLGWTEDEDLGNLQHLLNCQDLVKQLDWFLAGWAIKVDSDKVRRSLYGKMGACRYKPYGVEYRVLSNFWVPNEAYRKDVWNRMVDALNQMSKIYIPDRVNKDLENRLRTAINTSTIDPVLENEMMYPLTTLNARYSRY